MKALAKRFVLAAALASASLASAHEGEVHAEPASKGPGLAADAQAHGVFSASSEAYELVLEAREGESEDGSPLVAYVSDFRSNAPISKAEVTVERTGGGGGRVVLAETARAGVYSGVLPGSLHAPTDLLVGIRTEAASELFAANDFHLDEDDHAGPGDAALGRLGTGAWGLGALVLAAGVMGFTWWRRRRASGPGVMGGAALLLLLWAGSLGGEAQAHEEHEAKPRAEGAHESPPRAEGRVSAPGMLPAVSLELRKDAQFLLEIRTLPAQERELQPRLRVLGTVIPRPDAFAELRAPQAGRVVALDGKLPLIGDRVEAGQPLFALEQALGATERGELKSLGFRAQAELRQSEARLRQAEAELERLRSLPGIASGREVRAAEAEVAVAREERGRAQSELSLYQGTGGGLSRQVIRAPVSGTLLQAALSAGGQVSEGEVLVQVADLGELWVEAELYERDLPRLRPGAPALLRAEGYPRERFGAELLRAGQSVNRITRTARSLFRVENPGQRLKPGMGVELEVAVGAPQRALAVPLTALVEEEGRRFVFVHTAPERFERREVRLGLQDGEQVELLEGVHAGERVVSSGAYRVLISGR